MRSIFRLPSGHTITFPYNPDPQPLANAAVHTGRWTQTGTTLAHHDRTLIASDLPGVRYQIHDTAQDTISDPWDLIATIHVAHTAPGYLIDPSDLPHRPGGLVRPRPAVVLFTEPVPTLDQAIHVGVVCIGPTTRCLERHGDHISIGKDDSPFSARLSQLLENSHWLPPARWDHSLTLAASPARTTRSEPNPLCIQPLHHTDGQHPESPLGCLARHSKPRPLRHKASDQSSPRRRRFARSNAGSGRLPLR